MSERNIFNALRDWLVRRKLTYRALFWITGSLAFLLSPLIDNLTTALVMCAVVLAVGKGNSRFISMACVNIVVGANAGGAFSPFGDITTLMVWQRGIVEFQTFFLLLVPSLVNFLLPAFIMSFALPREHATGSAERTRMKRGAKRIMFLFACTITTAVSFHNFLNLPAFLGMMTGLAYLKFFGYYLRKTHIAVPTDDPQYGEAGDVVPFDSFREVERVEWDTLLFFFGVIMCVGGLSFIGYLEHVSAYIYGELGPTTANVLVGVMSAIVDNIPIMVAVLEMHPTMDTIVDNIPIMVAVLEMHPTMDTQQWLLVTLTAGVGGSMLSIGSAAGVALMGQARGDGVGGSMLSIGSAAGVALMGQARGEYTFFRHLKWTPVIALGYAASIWVHMLINKGI
jgi:Na+/H+ antiporter NhaD/arsenite permease-like protein